MSVAAPREMGDYADGDADDDIKKFFLKSCRETITRHNMALHMVCSKRRVELRKVLILAF